MCQRALGRHRLICGDARDQAVFELLMGDERADILFTDPPYLGPNLRGLHEQPDNGKGHAGSNARINVQCSKFVMQLARGGLRACLEGCARGPKDEQREHTRPC